MAKIVVPGLLSKGCAQHAGRNVDERPGPRLNAVARELEPRRPAEHEIQLVELGSTVAAGPSRTSKTLRQQGFRKLRI